jgi:hypothetical protein
MDMSFNIWNGGKKVSVDFTLPGRGHYTFHDARFIDLLHMMNLIQRSDERTECSWTNSPFHVTKNGIYIYCILGDNYYKTYIFEEEAALAYFIMLFTERQKRNIRLVGEPVEDIDCFIKTMETLYYGGDNIGWFTCAVDREVGVRRAFRDQILLATWGDDLNSRPLLLARESGLALEAVQKFDQLPELPEERDDADVPF